MELDTLKVAGYRVGVDVEFGDDDLDRLETDPSFNMGLSQVLVKAYRMRMQTIRAALDERDFRALKSLHFEKLKGNRSHQYSMRLNKQYRLIIEFEGAAPKKIVRIIAIEDYH